MIKQVEINSIIPYEKNAKEHTKIQIKKIADSIKEFGFTQPVVVDKNNVVIVGHGRLLAAKSLELKEVPVIKLDNLTEEQVNAYRLTDNKLNESKWNMNLVIEELKTLNIAGFNIELTGFSADLVQDEDEKDNKVPELPKQPKTKLGDVYELGKHRILCGDSTSKEDMQKLMGGGTSRYCFYRSTIQC
jgi:ParB-like chromosome segregation protein Spo0J